MWPGRPRHPRGYCLPGARSLGAPPPRLRPPGALPPSKPVVHTACGVQHCMSRCLMSLSSVVRSGESWRIWPSLV